MENASKALIIAGAILLSILIIGLGMGIFNQSKNAMNTRSLDQAEINAHNSQFEQYEGKQKGSTVKQLVNAIRSNNTTNVDRMVEIGFSTTTAAATVTGYDSSTASDGNDYTTILGAASSGGIKPSTTYFVTFTTANDGLINACEIHVFSDADL